MGNRSRVAVLVVAIVAFAGATATGVKVRHVYRDYGVNALSPGRETPRLPFDGRTYIRAAPAHEIPAFWVPLGHSPGHGTIYGYDSFANLANTVILVRYPDGTMRFYALSGGP